MNILFKQAAGLGDLIFLEPIARRLSLRGHTIYWPVLPMFQGISEYIPYVNWCDPGNITYGKVYEFDGLKPAKYKCRILESKYKYADFPLDIWRTFHYDRDIKKEFLLIKQLGLNIEEPYRLIHCEYDSNRLYTIDIPTNPDIKNIYIVPIPGFSLFDWSSVIENASEIHVVSTSSLYLIEKLHLIHNPEINLYARHNDINLDEVKFLLSPKPYDLIKYTGKVKNI